MERSHIHVVNGVLLIASAVVGVGAYVELFPPRLIPVSLITVLVAIVLYGIAWALYRYPSILNVPNQAAYDALPDRDRRKVVACVARFFYCSVPLWTGFFVVVLNAEAAALPEPATILVSAVVVSIVEGALAIRFLFLQTSRKVSELQEDRRSGTD